MIHSLSELFGTKNFSRYFLQNNGKFREFSTPSDFMDVLKSELSMPIPRKDDYYLEEFMVILGCTLHSLYQFVLFI